MLRSLRLACRESRPVGVAQRGLHQAWKVAAVVDHAGRRGEWHFRRVYQILTTDLRPVDAEPRCRKIQQALDEIDVFEPADPAIDIDRHGVRHIALEVEMSRRNRVGSDQHPDDVANGRCRLTRANMCAHVAAPAHAQSDDFAIAVECHRALGHMIARLGVTDEGFGAIGAPAYRATEFVGRIGARDVFGIGGRTRAEPATDVACRDPDTPTWRVERMGEAYRLLMHALRSDMDQKPLTRLIIASDAAARLHVVDDDPVVDNLDLDDLRGARKRVVGRPLIARFDGEQLVAPNLIPYDWRAGLFRVFDPDYRPQRIVIDLHRLGSFARAPLGGRAHARDRLDHATRLPDGKRPPGRNDHVIGKARIAGAERIARVEDWLHTGRIEIGSGHHGYAR